MNNTNINKYKINPLEAIGLLIIALFGGQIIGLVIGLISMISPAFKGPAILLSFGISFGISAIIIMLFKKLNFNDLLEFFKSQKKIQLFLFAFLLYLVSFPLIEFLTTLIPTESDSFPILKETYDAYKDTLGFIFEVPVEAFITVCILAPLLEELIFRGLLLRGLLNNNVNPWLSIILVALLFGTAHFNPWQFMGAGFLGFIFGFIYWRTKDLWICIFLHFLNNALSFIVSMQQGDVENDEVLFPPISIIISILLLVGLGYLFYRYTQKRLIY